MSASATDNPPPCGHVWQWQWDLPPAIFISAPYTWPDNCVGELSVGPATLEVIPGYKWQVDVGTCSPPYDPRYRTQVMPNVTNWWTLYERPPGTTPTSGTGLTAAFTTVHAGSVNVYFHARGTVTSLPLWDYEPWPARTPSGPPFHVGPEIYFPDDDPNTVDNHFVFSSPAGIPWPLGTCEMTPRAICGGSPDKYLRWEFPESQAA